MKRNVLSALIVGCLALSANAQVSVDNSMGKNGFVLVSPKDKALVCYDSNDALVIGKTVSLFVSDVKAVTGQTLATNTDAAGKINARNAIIVGTVGKSALIDRLVKKGKIDVTALSGKWEQYSVQVVKNPLPGVAKAIVVAGSDRRGAAYGLLSISRAIGVSPWYWWADAPITKRVALAVNVKNFVSKEPTVKYRGVFINDEDWGLFRWVRDNFDKATGNFGPKTYAKVCELLLRLQANYLCPAMHNCSLAFHKVAENRLVADSFAIVMGSSHCEPMLLNTATEWDKNTYGEWDYNTNKAGVDKVLRKRAEELVPFENVYTLALRGLHDVAMKGSNDMNDRKNVMQDALMTQRQMLVDLTGKKATDIPQAFTPYKEVLDVYDHGLELPDDVTIIWPDDNYGYMKRLSSPKEQKRFGRSGVYYHSSYLGRPHDYLWMNTTSPTFMYEELRKAYDMTADRIWLLNAGDIKSCEFAVDFFLSMAYDINSFDYARAAQYRSEWLGSMLGNEYRKDFQDISTSFFNLAFQRKPEEMGWGYQWSTDANGRERNTDTDFSLMNYRETDRRLGEYARIADKAAKIYDRLPEEKKACFYETLYYPVKGCQLLNRMILDGQRNRWYSLQKRASANNFAAVSTQCYDSLNVITKHYNEMLDGKWNHVMSMNQGFAAAYYEKPALRNVSLSSSAVLGISAEGEDVLKGDGAYHVLPTFNAYLPENHFVDVYDKGSEPLKWKAVASDRWIKLNKTAGTTSSEDRIEVGVDWNSVPDNENLTGMVTIEAQNGMKETVLVSAFNPKSPARNEVKGLYMETNGYVSIDAAGFQRKTENDDIKISVIPNLGCEGQAVQLGNPIAAQQRPGARNTPCVEYDFYTFEQGSVDVYTYVLPTFVPCADRGYAGHEQTNIETKYGVCIDNGPVLTPSTSSFEYAEIWYESVLQNCRINKTTLHLNTPGKHTVKIICGDAGTVLQKIVLDFGGMKRSYMGPKPTLVK